MNHGSPTDCELLPSVFGLAEVREWKERFAQRLRDEHPCHWSSAATERVDIAGLQLLLAVHLQAPQWTWSDPHGVLRREAERHGFADFITTVLATETS